MNAKQQRFVEEYMVDLNATQAAIRAGYSEATAYSQGERLLRHVEVADAIAAAQEARAKRTGVTADRVLQELARIGFSDLRKAFTEGGALRDPKEWDDDTAAAIASLKVVSKAGEMDEDGNRRVEYVSEVKFWDKNSALEKIAKHLGMFTEKHQHFGGVTVEVVRFTGDAE